MATQIRRPSGNSSVTWTPSAGTNWECVSDDSDLTYVETITQNTEVYTWPAWDFSSTSVTKLSITVRCEDDGTNCQIYVGRIVVNGTIYYGQVQNGPSSWTSYTKDWETNPDTGLAWTEADIKGTGDNPLQSMGFRGNGSDPKKMRCSSIIATVTYEEAVSGSNNALFFGQNF